MKQVRGNAPGGAGAPFTVMVKPVGSACNLRCEYCYYLDAPGSGPNGRMSRETLRALIRTYIAASPGPTVTFTWHGGEPMLAGLDFYREAAEIQKEMLPAGWECWNNLQTNGTLLDEKWCAFLAEEKFDVGVSLDGTAAVHDLYRKDGGGKPTWAKTVEGIRLLQKHGIQPDLLCTVTSESTEHSREVYQTLRDLGTGWMQFIPVVVRREDGTVAPESVSPAAYGRFLREVFCQWLYHDLDRTEVQLFSETALVLSGQKANLCWLQETCGRALVAESDGSVFSCDHFVRPEYRIGSVLQDGFAEMVEGEAQRTFGAQKKTGLTGECAACGFLPICHGGCPKDRFGRTPSGEAGQYCLCEGLKVFFSYAVPRLRKAMEYASGGMSRQEIMKKLAENEGEQYHTVNRNDPCPCGSGRKYKQCCGKLYTEFV